ncbi:MAG TPA: NAD-binding protein [Gaiellaceae bacterium]|nr:NAD-binding protein [Gaiellaceae bacterium]
MSTSLAVVALAASGGAIWLLLRTPLARRLVAVPSADRWHETPTPLLGGIGIFAGFSAGFWLAAAAGAFRVDGAIAGIYAGCALMFAAGFVDDLFSLPPAGKLAAQVGAAAIVLASGTHVQLVGNRLLGDAIAVLWLVGVTNAFNLLDNMDGLAATMAAIAFGFFAIDAVTVHPGHFALAFALAGALACAAFLPFNLRPRGRALVFMGDSGSQFVGFALAALGLASSWRVAGTTVATLILPILVLAVPILDTALVTVVRLLEGRPIYQGGRDHSSHRLVRYGLSEKHAVALLALIAACIGGSSLAYNVLNDTRSTVIGVVITFVLLVQFASFLADVERRPVERGEPVGFTQAFAVHWRRIVEVVVDFAVVTGSFGAAYLIEFGWPGSTSERFIGSLTLPVLLAARYLAFIPFGLYRSIWRYAGARDLAAIASAVVISELVTLFFMEQTQNMRDFWRSFFIVDALICMVAIAGSRFAERAIVNGVQSMRSRTGRRTLIVGAGRTGRSLMRELRETAGERVVGFVDDNPRLRRRRVHGVQVAGTTAELPRLLERTRPDVVLITIPNAPRERLDLVVDACERAGVPCRFVRREVDLDPRVVLGSTAE